MVWWLLACSTATEPAPQPPAASEPAAPVAGVQEYTCPMHPQIRQNEPGSCPICKMALEPVGAGGDAHQQAHASGGHMAQMAATRDALRADLGDAYDQPVPGLEAADAARGAALYEQHCASCHGAAGKGDGAAGAGLSPPPADFTDAFHARYYSDAGRVHIIEQGSPGTAMAPFQGTLDRAQILDVYAHVAAFRGAIGRP